MDMNMNVTESPEWLDAILEMRTKMCGAQLSAVDEQMFVEIVYLRFHIWLTENNVNMSDLFPNTGPGKMSERPDANSRRSSSQDETLNLSSTSTGQSTPVTTPEDVFNLGMIDGSPGITTTKEDSGSNSFYSAGSRTPSSSTSSTTNLHDVAILTSSCDQTTMSESELDGSHCLLTASPEARRYGYERQCEIQNLLRNVVRNILL
jgi:hypothetical protein